MQNHIIDLEKKLEEISKEVVEAQKEVNMMQTNVDVKLKNMTTLMKEIQTLEVFDFAFKLKFFLTFYFLLHYKLKGGREKI